MHVVKSTIARAVYVYVFHINVCDHNFVISFLGIINGNNQRNCLLKIYLPD